MSARRLMHAQIRAAQGALLLIVLALLVGLSNGTVRCAWCGGAAQAEVRP